MVTFPNDLEVPVEHKDEFYAAVGRLVIEWGLIEASLSMMIAVIYHEIGGKHVDETLPFMLKDKLAFIRKSLFQIAVLKPYRKKHWPLLQKISDGTEKRVAIVHGYYSGYDPETGRINFLRLDGGGTIHTERNLALTIREIQEAGLELSKLGVQLANEMTELADVFLKD